jgi:Ca2+-binding EF-hand superfamily protein
VITHNIIFISIPKTPVFEEPEKVVAKRLVELYRKQFDFIDAIVVDDLITAEELAEVYRVYEWPKELTDIADEVAYSKTIIGKYDKDNKGGMNFVDFCLYSEDLWDISDSIQEQKCSSGFEKANEIWSNFFKWLDRDNDGYLVMEDCIFGISKMMYRDADMDEIQKTFAEYGGADKKLNFDSFVLAIANGFLDKSLKDPNFTETLME